ncbi:putative nicotinate-nucleotide pyrophosphorylase (carboxylating) [Sporotomaculum syntrophicum]|uniref:Probable nicotinate-nucleotide pyrophosphorylase [carboxylating] n=1 Tax=Sporotomaculum syntrophicum TaxID=182264 RepID=A0A9D2WQI9_9FIRM|nr:carboxylating nicotinate-nucleotide diphosphorylase [Sporotomaculum syntrophicum]KAF1085787.1 putative nicotinate-nucleotide pyrophosphorylase (carboxylating) [Sporotomaculum syntrophicum]
MHINERLLNELIDRALTEDIGSGDLTTDSIVPDDIVAVGYIKAKQHGIVAGLPVARAVFKHLDPDLQFIPQVAEGAKISPGEVLVQLNGRARTMLTGERLALNFLQRLSGIATLTAALVELVQGYQVRIVDTRKTTPGLRQLEKYAVRVGGGHNHRLGLFDAVLIKDNHIKVVGGIKQAVASARSQVPHTAKIEVETEDLSGVQEALEAGADIIMLDNMDLHTMAEAVQLVKGRALVEASGGMSTQTIADVAATGVDIISVGALTHSATALDISLDVGELKPMRN